MVWGKKSKYKAVRTNGFPSKLEASVYNLLLMKESLGFIKEIRKQHSVVLVPGPPKIRIAWKVDFSFTNCKTGKTEFVEAKGIRTADFLIKLKLFRANPPGKLTIYGGDYRRPVVTEVIEEKLDGR